MTDNEKTAQHLMRITDNLAAYIEDQAQQIARPKIQAAERGYQKHLDQVRADFEIREQRSAAVIAELRRHLAALDKQREKAFQRELRIRAVADGFDTRDMHEAATQVRTALAGRLHKAGAR